MVIVYILYVDESGQAATKRSGNLFILSGVLIHEKDWKSIENKVSKVKQELFPDIYPNKWELHAHPIWNNTGFFGDEKLGVDITKKKEIFSAVVDIICKSEITIINVIIFKDRLKRRRESEIMKSSWSMLVSGFEKFLHKMSTPSNGLIFIDSSEKDTNEKISRIIRNLVGGSRRNNHLIFENPIFVESHMWNLIQLADMIAYIVHKHYKRDSKFEEWFNLLIPKMYHLNGKLLGYGIKTN